VQSSRYNFNGEEEIDSGEYTATEEEEEDDDDDDDRRWRSWHRCPSTGAISIHDSAIGESAIQNLAKLKLAYPANILNISQLVRDMAMDELLDESCHTSLIHLQNTAEEALAVPPEYYQEQTPSPISNIRWMMAVRESYKIWRMAAAKKQLFVHPTCLTPVRHIAEYLKNCQEFDQIDKCQVSELLPRSTRKKQRPVGVSTSCMTVRPTGARAATTGFDVRALFASFRDACGDSSGHDQQSWVNPYFMQDGRQIEYLLLKNSRQAIPDLSTLLQVQRHFWYSGGQVHEGLREYYVSSGRGFSSAWYNSTAGFEGS
jgi:hypothetical protein